MNKNYSYLLLGVALFSGSTLHAQQLTSAQIKQIEGIAKNIVDQINGNPQTFLDDMTVSMRAVAIRRNVRYEYVLRVKKGLMPAKLKEWADATRNEILPKVCNANANNPAFDRGLSYTFAYTNTYGENLTEFSIDKGICKAQQ